MADSVPMTSAIIWRRQVSGVWGRWVRGVLAWHSFTHPHNHSPTRPHNKKKPTGHLVQSLPPQVPPPIPRGPRKVVGADAGAGVGGLHAAHVRVRVEHLFLAHRKVRLELRDTAQQRAEARLALGQVARAGRGDGRLEPELQPRERL